MSGQRIFVVDDNEMAREVARAVLEDGGFQVECFGSGFQLNAAIREQRPDLILLDVLMPALGGEQVAQILKRYEFSKDIPVLLYSELPAEELVSLSELIGAEGFVRKSLATVELVDQVNHYISQSASPAPAQ